MIEQLRKRMFKLVSFYLGKHHYTFQLKTITIYCIYMKWNAYVCTIYRALYIKFFKELNQIGLEIYADWNMNNFDFPLTNHNLRG